MWRNVWIEISEMPHRFWSFTIRDTEKGKEILRAIGNETIKSYLLGSLEEPSKTRLEERLMNDAQLLEELLIAEDELVDHYVADRLSGDDRARFESHFLVTPDRVRKIQFGRAFQNYLERNDVAEAPSAITAKPFKRPFAFRHLRPPLIAFALLAVACLVSFGLYRMLSHQDGSGSQRIQVITLAPGLNRSMGSSFPRTTIADDTSTIELRLVVSEIRHRKYNADIQSESTRITGLSSSQTRDDNGEKSVIFSVSADRLPPDDYQVKLIGTNDAGEKELIDSYAFGIGKR